MAVMMYYMRRSEVTFNLVSLLACCSLYFTYSLVCNAALEWVNEKQFVIDAVFLVVLTVIIGYVLYQRRLAQRRAWQIVKADAKAYDDRWSEVEGLYEKALGDIAILARDVQQDCKAFAVLRRSLTGVQTNSAPASNEDSATLALTARTMQMESLQRTILSSSNRAYKSAGLQQLLSSLPLLYTQAFALNEHFQDKCAGWARDFGKHEVVSVKKQDRAIQKLWRTYNGNPQFLTDLVRSSIVCDTLDDVLEVFHRIRADPAVGILRVKNRLSPTYDSSLSGGYRNLALNLILVDESTCQACAEAHICELQLQLGAIHDLKTDGGHKRFVSFRDTRAG